MTRNVQALLAVLLVAVVSSGGATDAQASVASQEAMHYGLIGISTAVEIMDGYAQSMFETYRTILRGAHQASELYNSTYEALPQNEKDAVTGAHESFTALDMHFQDLMMNYSKGKHEDLPRLMNIHSTEAKFTAAVNLLSRQSELVGDEFSTLAQMIGLLEMTRTFLSDATANEKKDSVHHYIGLGYSAAGTFVDMYAASLYADYSITKAQVLQKAGNAASETQVLPAHSIAALEYINALVIDLDTSFEEGAALYHSGSTNLVDEISSIPSLDQQSEAASQLFNVAKDTVSAGMSIFSEMVMLLSAADAIYKGAAAV